MSDLFTVRELIAATTQAFKFDPFFLRLFFRETHTFTSEEVFLDKIPGEVPMAVYCAPLVTGKVMKTRGSRTSTFKPGYTKAKHTLNPAMSLKRRPGENPAEPETPVRRRELLIMQNLRDEETAIKQLEEYQAVQAVLYGKYTISGENVDTYEIDMQRSTANNIKQAGSTSWSTKDKETYDPTGDIDAYADNASGAVNVMVMDGKTWTLLNSFKLFREKLDTRRGSKSELETALKDLGKVVSFKGFYGDVAIYVYKGQYFDSASSSKQKYIPDNTLILGNVYCRGLRTYGAIQDEVALSEGVDEATRYPRTWVEKGDPAVTMTMTQSAPAMVLADADEFVVVTVA